jgi:hypothetical protein
LQIKGLLPATLQRGFNGYYRKSRRREARPVTYGTPKDLRARWIGRSPRDNGTGIPPGVREKMFNPFSRGAGERGLIEY